MEPISDFETTNEGAIFVPNTAGLPNLVRGLRYPVDSKRRLWTIGIVPVNAVTGKPIQPNSLNILSYPIPVSGSPGAGAFDAPFPVVPVGMIWQILLMSALTAAATTLASSFTIAGAGNTGNIYIAAVPAQNIAQTFASLYLTNPMQPNIHFSTDTVSNNYAGLLIVNAIPIQ